MPDVKQHLKIITEQKISDNQDKAEVEGYPWRDWNIEIYLVNEAGETVPASVFEKVTYQLHESFGKRAKQVKRDPPFRLAEEGWGGFEIGITLTPVGKGADISITHDLSFEKNRYEADQTITFKNPKQELANAIKEATGGGVENGARRGGESAKKRGKKDKSVDMEKLADGLQRLGEEDLLHIVQLIHDQKSPDTYTKNDVENGEFHVDLYTLPDGLVKTLWDFTGQKVEL